MSLHKFADMVAKQGRGDDSLLIHMTPDEVRNLQRFAEANGKTLTINPTTGLPEAGMLSDLFKTIAPIALGAFLGPAGVALGGPGLTAGMAGLATGGITALATGSLSRGLMAGLGAYGGAGIGESLMNAGTGALSQSVGAGLSEEAAQQAVASKLASATPMETLTAGFNSATASPAAMGTFAKNNLTNIGMAAAPIMAGAMVPTTTKMPENTNPAYIRQKLYDPYTQTYKSLAPVKASEFGGRNFSDAYTNPQTGQMDTLQPRAPSGFAGGGIVALAGGGVSDQQIKDWFATNQGASDTDIYNAMKEHKVGTEQLTNAMGFDPTDVGRRYDVQARNDIFSPTRSRSEQESMVNQYYQDQGIPADRLSQTNFGYPVDTRESRLESVPYTNLYEKYQQDLAATGRYDAPSNAQYRAQAMYMPDSIGNRGSIQLIDSATGQQLTNLGGANSIGNTANAFELLDKFGVDPASYRQAASQMYESMGKPTYMQDDYAYLTGYKPRDVTGKTDTYLTKPLTNVTAADLKPKYEKDANDRQTADSKTNVDWLGSTQRLLMSKGMGASEATNYLHQLIPVSGLVDWAEISKSKDPVKAVIGTLNYLQSKKLTNRRFASGGLASLAGGGAVPGYAAGGYKPSDTDIFNYFKTPNLSDAKIAQDMATFGVSAADIARATGTQGQQADYEKRFVNTLIAPTTDASEFQKATSAVGLQNQALATAMQNAGLSQGAQYALTQPAQNDAGFTGGIIDSKTGKAVDLYNQIGYKAGALPGDQAGLEGLYGNINYVTGGLQNLISTGKMSVADAQNAALAELARTGVSVADVKAATGKDFGNLFTAKKPDPIVCGPGMELNAAGTACVPKKVVDKNCATGYHFDEATQQCVKNTSAVDTTTTTVNTPTSLTTVPATALPVGVGGTTGPSIFGGGATVNPNGTITTSPVIPGIPVGGFTGMESLRNAYTTGGGSLGYIPKAPKTMAEFEQLYNKQTGDSLAAYDYLMGKGGGKYPVQSKAASTAEGIMRPYFSAGVKYKPRFLSAGKDGTVTESSTNPNAPKAGGAKAAELTKAKTIEVVDSSGYNTETYTAVLQEDGTYLAGNGKRYDVTGKQLAAGGGMMGYAVGGGLGSLGSYSDGGRLLKGPGDGVSDSIPATIGAKQQPARLADGEFVIPARIVSELGNGSTDAGAKKLYAMMDRVQRARGKTTGKNKVAANSRADKYLPA
jgi:hypothetical protein